MEKASDAEFEAIFANAKAVAVPARLLPPEKRRALRSGGTKVTAQMVKAGPYEIDAVVIRCSPKTRKDDFVAKLMELFVLLADTAPKPYFCDCTVDEVSVPFIAAAGKVSVLDDAGTKLGAPEEFVIGQALKSYRSMLADFSALTGLEIRFHNGGGDVREPFKDEPGVLHIFTKAGPPGEYDYVYKAVAFGTAIMDNNNSTLCRTPAKGRGRTIGDKNESVPLVQIVGSNAYILIPTLTCYHSPASDVIFARLLALIWTDLRAHAKDAKAQKRANASLDALMAYGRECVTEYAEICLRSARETDQDIQRVQKKLAELVRNKREYETLALAYAESATVTDALGRLPEEFRRIRRSPLVARIDIVDKGIHVETRLITATHAGKTYALGRYVIRIGAQGTVNVWCVETLHPKGVPHPHIQKDGWSCYGNAVEAITKLAVYHRYADVVDLVLRWLTNGYTAALALVKIEEWPEHGVTGDLASIGFVERTATPEEASQFGVEPGGIIHVPLSDEESSDSKVVGADAQQGGA